VGDFTADLRGKDATSGRPVVIENQLGPTDHSHLGQLLTYSAGLDAAIVVWIAPLFREEHRQAVDWLNEHTDETLDFFGVELELLRVDDSLPAPHFKLVAQPNEWTKAARKAAAGEAGPASERDLRYKEFLGSILEELKRQKPHLTSASRVSAKSFYYLAAGRAGFLFGFNFSGKGFNVELYINPKPVELNKALFDALKQRESEINAAIGYPLLWERLDNRLGSRITARREGATIDDPEASLAELRQWAVAMLIRFTEVFRPLLPTLKPADGFVAGPHGVAYEPVSKD